MAYNPAFTGGVFVAAGDLNGDGRADVITGAGPGGGPHVRAFSGTDNAPLASFFAYAPAFTGGVSVGYFKGQIVTGAGPGGGPHVKVFQPGAGTTLDFFAFDPAFRGGVFVGSAGGTNGQVQDTLVVSAGAGGTPHVKVFGFGFRTGPFVTAEFDAYDARFAGGVRVATADLDGDAVDEIVTAAGATGGPHVRVWRNDKPPTLLREFFAFDPAAMGGIFVG
jgi:FG-GAP repeat